jgi:hypothetical protein
MILLLQLTWPLLLLPTLCGSTTNWPQWSHTALLLLLLLLWARHAA